MKLIMLQGLPGSGKSTWAREQVYMDGENTVRVNKDDLRAMLHDGVHSKKREQIVLAMRDAIVETALYANKNVIVDDTNLSEFHKQTLHKIALKCGADFEVKFFNVSLEECVARDAARSNPIGADVIYEMYRKHLSA